MSAPISFTLFTSNTVLFASKDAANAFFNAMTVGSASTSQDGVVKKSVFVALDSLVSNPTYQDIQVMQGDGSFVTTQVPSKESFDALLTLVKNLRQTEINAGQRASS